MAKATLPTNFQDDIMNDSMEGKRKYNLIQNADGTVSLEDFTTYDQVGSNFGAAQINATNTAVNAAADAGKIIDSLDTISATTQSGYMAGALAVKELNSNLLCKDYKNTISVTPNSAGLVKIGISIPTGYTVASIFAASNTWQGSVQVTYVGGQILAKNLSQSSGDVVIVSRVIFIKTALVSG